MSNKKGMKIHLIIGQIKKISLNKISNFPEPYSCNKKKIKVELDFFKYATKSDLQNATGINTSKFAKKADLAVLKSNVDRLDIGKLKATYTDVGKVSHVTENEKAVYDELVKSVNAIQRNDTSNL